MRSHTVKLILPLLLALLLGVLPAAFAAGGHEPTGTDKHAAAVDSGHGAAEVKAAHPATDEPHAAAGAEAAGHGDAAGHGEAAGHGDAGGHGDAHVSNSLSPEKLKDLFWRTVNFLVLVLLLVKFLAKPIGSGLTGRQKQIKEELEDLQASRDAAEKEYKDFEVRLAGMEKEMETVVEKAIAQAHNEKERILADAERAAEDIKRNAEAAVQAEIVDAKRVLLDEVAEEAAKMAEELIVKNLTPADQSAITEQYLDRVGAVQ